MTRADGRHLAPLFDTYVVVDWSARNQPAQGADSIWLAELTADGRLRLSNPPTRRDAEQSLWDLLDRCRELRVLLTVDVALGYPSGTAALFGLQGVPWMAMWAELARLANDDDRNRNNRFDVAAELNRRGGLDHGPFWGCPAGRACHTMRPNKWAGGAVPVAEFRESERALPCRRSVAEVGVAVAGSRQCRWPDAHGSAGARALPIRARAPIWRVAVHDRPDVSGARSR